MPLNKAGLKSALLDLDDNAPASRAGAAASWASAMGSYAGGIVPASSTVAAAQATLQTALAGIFEQSTNQASALEAAFLAFATTIGGGMAGFTPVPPTGLIGWAAFSSGNPSTRDAACTDLSDRIDTWMKLGTATPIPSGSPVNWS